MLSTPPSAPHELCLSSASADRYEGHGTREYALAAEHARRRSPFQKGYEEGTPRHCVPCSDGQSLKLRPTLPSNTVPRASSFTSVRCGSNNQDLFIQSTSDSSKKRTCTCNSHCEAALREGGRRVACWIATSPPHVAPNTKFTANVCNQHPSHSPIVSTINMQSTTWGLGCSHTHI